LKNKCIEVTYVPDENTKKIASLNDSFRRTLTGGLVVLTPGVESLPSKDRIIEAVRTYQFQGIDDDNPYGENDFGTVTIEGEKYFFKIDYYDRNLEPEVSPIVKTEKWVQ
jgi:hypothetical protein